MIWLAIYSVSIVVVVKSKKKVKPKTQNKQKGSEQVFGLVIGKAGGNQRSLVEQGSWDENRQLGIPSPRNRFCATAVTVWKVNKNKGLELFYTFLMDNWPRLARNCDAEAENTFPTSSDLVQTRSYFWAASSYLHFIQLLKVISNYELHNSYRFWLFWNWLCHKTDMKLVIPNWKNCGELKKIVKDSWRKRWEIGKRKQENEFWFSTLIVEAVWDIEYVFL